MSIQSRQGCILDDVLEHATQPERDFFAALDTDLKKIANFYYGTVCTSPLLWRNCLYVDAKFCKQLEKKHEAETKLAALKTQVMLIEEYGKHLVQVGVKCLVCVRWNHTKF